jgi:hypothetical protein
VDPAVVLLHQWRRRQPDSHLASERKFSSGGAWIGVRRAVSRNFRLPHRSSPHIRDPVSVPPQAIRRARYRSRDDRAIAGRQLGRGNEANEAVWHPHFRDTTMGQVINTNVLSLNARNYRRRSRRCDNAQRLSSACASTARRTTRRTRDFGSFHDSDPRQIRPCVTLQRRYFAVANCGKRARRAHGLQRSAR